MATQVEQHRYVESKVDPGTCVVCRLIKRNQRHSDTADPAPDVQQRRAGDAR